MRRKGGKTHQRLCLWIPLGEHPPTRKRKPPARRSIKNAHSPSYTKKKHTVSIRRRSFLERSCLLAETCSVARYLFHLRAANQNLTCNLQRTGLFPVRKTDAERELFPWKAFATFHPFVKGCTRPSTRGKALRQQNSLRQSAKLNISTILL